MPHFRYLPPWPPLRPQAPLLALESLGLFLSLLPPLSFLHTETIQLHPLGPQQPLVPQTKVSPVKEWAMANSIWDRRQLFEAPQSLAKLPP